MYSWLSSSDILPQSYPFADQNEKKNNNEKLKNKWQKTEKKKKQTKISFAAVWEAKPPNSFGFGQPRARSEHRHHAAGCHVFKKGAAPTRGKQKLTKQAQKDLPGHCSTSTAPYKAGFFPPSSSCWSAERSWNGLLMPAWQIPTVWAAKSCACE